MVGPKLACALDATVKLRAATKRRPCLRSHARPRGHSIGATHITAFGVVAPSEAQMPDKSPQSDCDGGVFVSRDTGFPKHGAMLRIGARGEAGCSDTGGKEARRLLELPAIPDWPFAPPYDSEAGRVS